MRYYLYQLFQIVSLITALFCFSGLKKFRLAAFIPLHVIVVITEAIASNHSFFGWPSNYLVYSIYFIISTPFLMYITYQMLLYRGWAKLVYIAISIAIPVFLIYNVFFIQGPKVITTNSYFTVESTMAIFSFLVILRLFLDDDTSIMLNRHPYFWISAGTIIFAIGALFIMGISGYIKEHKIQLNGRNIYRYVTPVLNYILYGSYTYAFILCRKITTRSY